MCFLLLVSSMKARTLEEWLAYGICLKIRVEHKLRTFPGRDADVGNGLVDMGEGEGGAN